MKHFQELPQLFFETRQLIRSQVPKKTSDPNEWMRCEALRYIQMQSPSPTMKEIAEYLRVKAPSATSVVEKLEREGMVARARETNDKRVVRIVLTAKGRLRVQRYLENAGSAMERVFSKIPGEDVRVLIRILRSLRDAHGN